MQWSNIDEKQRLRAMKIQSPDYNWSPTKGDAPPKHRYTMTFMTEWMKFIDTLPMLHKAAFSEFNNVFFYFEAAKNYMAIRRQLSGICSAHASVLYQNYIESCRRGSQEENHKMLDISSFIRCDLPKDIQKRYIEQGTTGIGSFDLTRRFTGTLTRDYNQYQITLKSEDEEVHKADLKAIYLRVLNFQEPGLVTNFRVGGEFSESAILQGPIDEERYDQKVRSRNGKGSFHAMVLIGAYHNSEEDRFWFLLQNTDTNDYFKLVDGEHLASSDTVVFFAKKRVDMSLKHKYATAVGEYSETVLDMEECMVSFEGEEQELGYGSGMRTLRHTKTESYDYNHGSYSFDSPYISTLKSLSQTTFDLIGKENEKQQNRGPHSMTVRVNVRCLTPSSEQHVHVIHVKRHVGQGLKSICLLIVHSFS